MIATYVIDGDYPSSRLVKVAPHIGYKECHRCKRQVMLHPHGGTYPHQCRSVEAKGLYGALR